MNVVLVLPTYNEAENIGKFIDVLLEKFQIIEQETDFTMSILVVDDFSPDGTADIVRSKQEKSDKINLLMNNQRGLGKAYIAGFKYAIENLNPDFLVEMDSDFSHNPDDLIRLLEPVNKGYDFVIGSRYVEGGSIPDNWSLFRKLNSKYGNVFARHIAGISHVKDCTSGFRVLRVSILNKIDFNNLNANGYSFQMNILYEMVMNGARVFEVPIHFIDREFGESKLGLKDIIEFMKNSFGIRFDITKRQLKSIFSFLRRPLK